MVIESPFAAPSIISPMIEVPLTRDPPFSTSTDTLSGRRLTKVTNLALARACRPRWLVISDRKSVVWGKSVSVRVDLGGRRIIKKNEQIIHVIAQRQIRKKRVITKRD